MRTANKIFISFLLLVVLSMASVSASDVDNTTILSSDNTLDVIASDETNIQELADGSDDVIASDEVNIADGSDDLISSNEENIPDIVDASDNKEILKDASFDILQGYIDAAPAGSEISLDNNYSLSEGGSTLKISKSITINGNNNSLSGDYDGRILIIDSDGISVILKNIVFEEGNLSSAGDHDHTHKGSAIYNTHSSSSLTIIDCDFEYNYASFDGGAIYADGNLSIDNSRFNENQVDFGSGGAVYCNGKLFINNTVFADNIIQFKNEIGSGGAIYCEKECTIYNTDFHGNTAGIDYNSKNTFGGAIHAHANLFVYNTTFIDNEARYDFGGAIYCEGNLYGESLGFDDNKAYCGGAIYCEGETHINSSKFLNNRHVENTTQRDHDWYVVDPAIPVLPSEGGAIYSGDKCYIDSCTFDNNSACEHGGSIYANSSLTISGKNIFSNNHAYRSYYFNVTILTWRFSDKDGGAIYCRGDLSVSNANFSKNKAYVDGGAIYCEGKSTLHNSNFDGNGAYGTYFRPGFGGAIRSEGFITVDNCNFTQNRADVDGGAIYADGKSEISNSIFKNNLASDGIERNFGGAIRSKGSIEVNNCSFEENAAWHFGGAIYADDDLRINNTNFTDNSVSDDNGGAIYCEGNAFIDNAIFSNNRGNVDGGAIFCEKETTISNSHFNKNKVSYVGVERCYGGAVRSKGSITVNKCSFDDNYAKHFGGAIYSDNGITIQDSSFSNNKAQIDGGAVYSDGKTTISNSAFNGNEATGENPARSFGGAVRSNGAATINKCSFEDNFAYNLGGAIYVDGNVEISNSNFSSNKVYVDGGAVYSEGETTISNSRFDDNKATGETAARSFGGAVRSLGAITVSTTYFNDNYAKHFGGAIYADKKIIVDKCIFIGNVAYVDGGAIYSDNDVSLSESLFSDNKATGNTSARSYGGAVHSEKSATVIKTNFYNNYAYNRGGALYADKTTIKDSKFINNSAMDYGGAVYTNTISQTVSNSVFNNNEVTGDDGGAIYINNKCDPEFSSCSFEENTANERGGAIYLDSLYSYMTLSDCTFISNSAASGGAVYAHQIPQVLKSVFLKNKATAKDGNGGALYIKNDDPGNYSNFCEFTSCRFEGNYARNLGGAIYENSKYANLIISYCTFVDNHADKNNYGMDSIFYYSPGHSIYNTGYYKLIDMCWFGNNAPDFSGQLAEYHFGTNDEDHKPDNYLRIFIKLNETSDLYVGNTYKVTVYFMSTKGNSLHKDLFHSTGKFYGWGNFSNAKLDLNDMTADVVFTKENPGIFGKLDGQVVALALKVKEKNPSEVLILSCENVTYPNAVEVKYQILNMSGNAEYLIENSQGRVVKQGRITSPDSTLSIENLDIGDYSITINNPETLNTLPSQATARFKVSRTVSANVTADNVIYGNPTTITLKTDYDGLYNVKIKDIQIEMNVVNGICQKQVNLDAGDYQTQTSSSDYLILTCNEASFKVDKASNNVAVEVENVSYGTPSIIKVIADADGVYAVDINGTIFNVTVNNGVGNNSAILNAGSYYANVSFDNKNYNTLSHNGVFTVYKANVDLVIIVFDEIYGDEIEGIVYSSRDGEYNLTIAGYTTIVTVKNNFAYFEHTTLNAGTYNASVSFAGDGNYNGASDKTNFTVYPSGTSFELNVIPSEITYGETANVTHELPDSATGNISYYLGNGTFLGMLDISENLTLPVLDVGTYVIIGNYSGDNNFNSSTDSAFLIVNQAPNNVIVSVSNVTYGEDTQIKVSADVDGTYQLDLNGTIYNLTVKNGFGNKTIRLNTGIYYANISLDDGNYNTIAHNATFEVYKANINLYIEASSIVYPHELEGIVYSNLDGEYNLTIGNYSTLIHVNGGRYEFNLGVLDVGSYQIIANYSGDENHNPADFTLPVTVSPALNNAVVTVENVTYGELSLIVVTADANGTYQVDVNGTVFNVTVVNGSGNISVVFDAGIYYANVSFDNKNYNTHTHNASFEVYKADTDIVVVAIDTVYPNEIEGIIYSNVDGEFNLTIGEYSTIVIVKGCFGEFNAGVFDAGNYSVVVSYSGDLNHNPSSSSDNVTVDKFSPDMRVDVSNINYGGVEIITISCNIPGSVNITVNGITQTLELNGQRKKLLFSSASNLLSSSNRATLSLYGLSSGSYPVTVVYNGDKNHENVRVFTEFKVNALNVTMDIDTEDISVGEDEKITVRLSSNVSGTVTVSVDGKNYTAKVKDGKAIISIPNLTSGKKVLKVHYSGDENHNPSSETVSFEVHKFDVNMSVHSNSPSSGKKIHITVTLPDDATGTVTIALNGKNYTSTVKDGKARFDIPGLPAGKYDFTAYYSGDDKFNPSQINSSITVKDNGNNNTDNNRTDNGDNNHTKNNQSNNKYNTHSKGSSNSVMGLKSSGNPIFVLLLSLMAIGVTTIRRFKK